MKTIFQHKIKIMQDVLTVCVGIKGKDLMNYIKRSDKKIYKSSFEGEDWLVDEVNNIGLGKMITYKDGNGNIFMFLLLKEFNNTMGDLEVLLHEIVHFKQDLWDFKNIGKEEIEFEAYFIESIFSEIIDILINKYNKKHKK